MSDTRWKQQARQLEQTTNLSKRQAEVFTLRYLVRYPRQQIAELLDIAPSTVSRHVDELSDKIDKSTTLARIEERRPFCKRLGRAACKHVSVELYENRLITDPENTSMEQYHMEMAPSEQYQLELRRRTYPEEESLYRERTTTKYRFHDKTDILDAIRAQRIGAEFIPAACVYSALTEALDETMSIPPFGSLFEGTPPQAEIERVIDNGLLSPTDVQSLVGVTREPTDLSLGRKIGTDIPIPYDFRDGRVTCISGLIGSGATYTAKTLITRMQDHAESPPDIICIDLLESFTEFVPDGNSAHITSSRREQITEALPSEFNGVHNITVAANDIDEETPAVLERVITETIQQINSTESPTCIVVDEAHALNDATWARLMGAAEDDTSSILSWICVTHDLSELPAFDGDAPVSPEQDGFILHKLRGDGLATFSHLLSAPHREFLREANSGKSEHPKQALASTPGTDEWIPAEVEATLAELAVISEDS